MEVGMARALKCVAVKVAVGVVDGVHEGSVST